jgi:hypothetical protein
VIIKQGIVDWWKLIWFPLSIPKHDFIAWLALKNALSIGSKLLQWGHGDIVGCTLQFLQKSY